MPPVAPLDILAQQVVAECAAVGEDGIGEQELRSLVRHAAPYAALGDEDFEAVLTLVSEGVTTGRGVRGAHVHRDRVNRRGCAPGVGRGSRRRATSGGAIPELADYRVVVEPDEALVGTVHEDFAVEAMAGDVFLLGSTSWRVRRVEQGTVRVVDADGAAPTLPFWLGEAPGRTDELADAVTTLRELVEEALDQGGPEAARRAVTGWSRVEGRPVEEAVAYLAAAAPRSGRCRPSGGSSWSASSTTPAGCSSSCTPPTAPASTVASGSRCASASAAPSTSSSRRRRATTRSCSPSGRSTPSRWRRWLATSLRRPCATCSSRPCSRRRSSPPAGAGTSRARSSRPAIGGPRHLPPAIQRMEADDLMAAIFPALAACQENVTGPIEIPDHPIVRQTLDDCCTEAMDLAGLTALVAAVRDGTVEMRCVDTTEPSVLSHEILNGRPYTFLDDAPLEERRTRAVPLRRGIPLEAHDLSTLDPEVIEEVRAEVVPDPRDPEELHELLCSLVGVLPDERWRDHFEALAGAGRAMTAELRPPAGPATATGSGPGASLRWCATRTAPGGPGALARRVVRPRPSAAGLARRAPRPRGRGRPRARGARPAGAHGSRHGRGARRRRRRRDGRRGVERPRRDRGHRWGAAGARRPLVREATRRQDPRPHPRPASAARSHR